MAAWRIIVCSKFCLLLCVLDLSSRGIGRSIVVDASDEPIPDKVGVEVHLTTMERGALKQLECTMCKAILREMHIEVVKHKMTSSGWGSESQVWETSNAICLAMLQKYRLTVHPPKLEKKPEDEEDEEFMARAGANAMDNMRAMLVLKMGCQQWVEDYGGETSGYIYKTVRDGSNTAEGAAQDFCLRIVHLCGSRKLEKQKQKKDMERQRQKKRAELIKKEEQKEAKEREQDPFKNLPEDSKFGLQRMLELAKDDPLHYMEDDAKVRVHQARADLRCDVCRTVIDDVYSQVSKQPKSMRREYDILPLIESACEGGKDLSVPSYFGVEAPPLPPIWTDRVRPQLSKTTKRWALKKFPKRAAKARQTWRELTVGGKHKPPHASEAEGDMMLTMACKDMLEPERMAEALYKQMSLCEHQDLPAVASAEACDPGLAAARIVCNSADGAVCDFGGGKTNSVAREGGEL